MGDGGQRARGIEGERRIGAIGPGDAGADGEAGAEESRVITPPCTRVRGGSVR